MAWPPLQTLSNTKYRIIRSWAVDDLAVQVSIVCSYLESTNRDSLDYHFRSIGFGAIQIYIRAFKLASRCKLHHVSKTVIEPIHFDLGMIVQQTLLDAKIEAPRTFRTKIRVSQECRFRTE